MAPAIARNLTPAFDALVTPALAALNADSKKLRQEFSKTLGIAFDIARLKLGLGTTRAGRVGAVVFELEKFFAEAGKTHRSVRKLTNEELWRVMRRKLGRHVKSESGFQKYRAYLSRIGALRQTDGGWYYVTVTWLAIARPCDRIRGQNVNKRRSVHKFEKPLLESKTLRLKDSKGRFYIMADCTARPTDDAETGAKNLPHAVACEKSRSEAQPETRQTAPEQPNKPDLAQRPRPFVLPPMPEKPLPLRHRAPSSENKPFDVRACMARLNALPPLDDYRHRVKPVRPAESILGDSSNAPLKAPRNAAPDQPPPPPQPLSFTNDHRPPDQDFFNYTMRQVPGLRDVRWASVRFRQYPIRIWRMAVAGYLSVYPGQIRTTPAQFLIDLASRLAKKERHDPRREKSYRLVRRCAVSEEFAGLAAFRSHQDKHNYFA